MSGGGSNSNSNSGGGWGTGGTGGSGGTGQNTNEQTFTWNGGDPGQQGGPIFGFGETGFNPGDFAKTLGHDTNAAYSQGPKVFDQSLYAGMGDETRGLLNSSLGGPLQDIAGGGWLDQGNPYFEQMLAQTQDNTRNTVNQQFSNSGRLGSTSHIGDLTSSLADQEIRARYGNFDNEYQRMLGAQQQGLGLTGMLDSDVQQTLTAENDLFRRQNDANLGHVQDYMGLFKSGLSKDDSVYQQPENPWANVMSTGLGLLGGVGSILSDERAKENVKQVGKTKDGQKVYSYNYKGDDVTHMGLIAQEVAKDHPEAVTKRPDGLLQVNYGEALKDAA